MESIRKQAAPKYQLGKIKSKHIIVELLSYAFFQEQNLELMFRISRNLRSLLALNTKQVLNQTVRTSKVLLGSTNKDGFLERMCPFTISTPHHSHRLVFVIRFMDELELALKIIKKRVQPYRPQDQCHIFIQPHLLEWNEILANQEVLSVFRENIAELHFYDHEGSFFSLRETFLIEQLRFHSLVVADMFYNDFSKLIELEKYDLKNNHIGNLLIERRITIDLEFEQ